MRNNVEILRSILFTKEDLETFQNLGDEYTAKEIEFMVEFKKIYEFGLNQLELFINKLDEEGKDLDEYTIQYYVTQLFNGPLGQHARKLSEDKNYFGNITDCMGMIGNNGKTSSNTALYEGVGYPLGCEVDLYNKLPDFMHRNILDTVKQGEDMFRSNLQSFVVYDNTLPLMDKKPQDRYNDESKGLWVLKSNGSYMVKDSWYSQAQTIINKTLFDKIKEYLGDENFRIWSDKKTYNAFSDKNDSTSQNYKLEKKLTENGKEEIVTIDLMGSVFDSVKRRESVLKVSNPIKDKEYKLNTVEGQLGI